MDSQSSITQAQPQIKIEWGKYINYFLQTADEAPEFNE